MPFLQVLIQTNIRTNQHMTNNNHNNNKSQEEVLEELEKSIDDASVMLNQILTSAEQIIATLKQIEEK